MKPYKFGASFCRFNNQMKCNYIFKTFVFKNCGKVLIIKKSAVSFEHFKCEHVERNNNNQQKIFVCGTQYRVPVLGVKANNLELFK